MRLPSFVLQTRLRESLSHDVLNVIDAVTLDDKQPPRIVGSFQYIVHEYPGDIDLIEEFTGCCSVHDTAVTVANNIRRITERIKKLRYTYLGDFKVGVDQRLYISSGDWVLDERGNLKLEGYDFKQIKTSLSTLLSTGLILEQEHNEIVSLLKSSPTFKEHKKISDRLRNLYVLRWTVKELSQGFKVLRLNKTVYLEEAVAQGGSVIKIDVYSLIQGRFVEISNFFLIKSVNKKGDATILSSNQSGKEYLAHLMRDIVLYAQPFMKKTIKMAKRLWLRAVKEKDKELILKLYPLFSAGPVQLSQVLSDIETMQNMTTKLNNPPYRIMVRSLQEIKMRLGTVRGDTLPEEQAIKLFKMIDKINPDTTVDVFVYQLDELHDFINEIVDSTTIKYLKENKLDYKVYVRTYLKNYY